MSSIKEKDFGINNYSKFTGTGTRLDPLVRSVDVDSSALPTGASTEAKQDDVITNQTDGSQKTQIVSSTGDIVEAHDGLLHIATAGHAIAEGLISGHKAWLRFGYNPVVANVEETLWSAGGTYVWMTVEQGLEVVSSDNAQDIGTQIKTGTSTGGSLTTLIDTGADFTAATAVAANDIIILDKSGAVPEWGIVTAVTATTLTISGGFSSGGTGSARDYIVLDYSAHTGAFAVFCKYLDDTFAEHEEIIILNGTTPVPTVNLDYYRVNGFY